MRFLGGAIRAIGGLPRHLPGDEYVGTRDILVTLDSGAAASVCPANAFPDYEQEAPDPGMNFLSANGEMVPELWKGPLVIAEEEQIRTMQFSVAEVHKPLMSAAQVANKGHRIVLEAADKESYVEDVVTGERMRLYQHEGVYVQRLKVVDGQDAGFGGQAGRQVGRKPRACEKR